MSTKKKKEVFDPFARRCTHTSCTPQPVPGLAPAPPVEVTPHLGEFQGASLTITPALPKSEVSLAIQFSCTVNLMEGDVILIFLPGFKGLARQFALETEVQPDGLDTARSFLAYWSGDAKRKGAGKGGIPPKQVLQLRCTRDLEENTPIRFSVPQSLGLVSPDKLANNSPKIRIEGKVIRCAEGSKIAKQSFLSSTEIVKKVPIVDELETYDRVINQLASMHQLSQDHRVLVESLTVEEVEQVWEAAVQHRPYALAMPWSLAPATLFHNYEDNGAFVKKIMENVVSVVKRKDPLALHREISTNWNVKLAAVLVLEDVLAMQCASLYPGVSRTALLAVYVLTMLPSDVARVFATTAPPKNSIMQELESAVRMRDGLAQVSGHPSAEVSAAPASPPTGTEVGHSERILNRWAALTSYLTMAGYAVSDDHLRQLSNGAGLVADGAPAVPAAGDARGVSAKAANGAASRGKARDTGETWGACRPTAYLRPPSRLFVGLRDVATAELEHMQTLHEGDWFMFPNFVLAREEPPVPQRKDDVTGGAASDGQFPLMAGSSTHSNGARRGDGEGDDDDDDEEGGGDASLVPDNAILFEVCNAVEGLELADLSLYPCQREWFLPFSTSYRVIAVKKRGHLNDMLHVTLEAVGSLAGAITDELIPEGDQLVASMVVRRLITETDKTVSVLSVLSRLILLNVRRSERRRLHPPTFLRSEYLSRYQEVQWASEAKQTLEDGTVVWQVCTHPAEMLMEEVVKPSTWEPIPSKYALQAEMLFLARTHNKKILDEGDAATAAAAAAGTGGRENDGRGTTTRAATAAPGKPGGGGGGKKNAGGPLVIDLAQCTIDYGGRGPRALRRVVCGFVTYSAVPPDSVAVTGGNNITAPSLTVPELEAKKQTAAEQLMTWNVKLGLVENPLKKSTGKERKSASSKGAKSKTK